MEKVKKTIKLFRLFFKINWIKTFYINFKTQNFIDALKFPIIVFGKLKIRDLCGKITFNCSPKFGLVQIGKNVDDFAVGLMPCIFNIKGELILNGPTIISGGTTLTIWNGTIELGKYVVIASGTNLKAYSKIFIGDYSRIAANCFIMDTNVHFILNNNTNKVSNIYGEIYIGKFCWLNSGTIVAKGTYLPDYCITARYSLINKSYEGKGLFLAGSPAVIKQSQLQRIFGASNERKFKQQFLDSNLEVLDATQIIENDDDFKPFFKII